ncbi:MAG: hypothetical protein GXY28_10110 [Bacteriovoracaceae bacterium]|nr:hypothetical protein [Bacteriovoracaceae bacterium]HQO81166.1 inverse autotransporter beta domain-containing protein [Deltaproteobacteria bacterium]HRT45932.1 inverse autotransporter beta domain-containing protein [Desulfomonilia bacterium]
MMKKLFLAVFFCLFGTSLFAVSSPEVVWVGGAWRLSDESSPIFMADTFLSLGQMDSTYIFTEPLLILKSGELGLGLGAGARVPVMNGQALAGYNAFFDYTTDNYHKRLTIGGEFFYPTFSAHINAYLPFSDDHDGEEALPGIDFTVGIPIPNASFITLWPGMYYYDGKDEDDMTGLSFVVEAKPVKALSVFIGGRNDALESGRDRGELFVKFQVTIPMERLGEDLFKFEQGQYPLNVNAQLDHRVVREPFITYENKRP